MRIGRFLWAAIFALAILIACSTEQEPDVNAAEPAPSPPANPGECTISEMIVGTFQWSDERLDPTITTLAISSDKTFTMQDKEIISLPRRIKRGPVTRGTVCSEGRDLVLTSSGGYEHKFTIDRSGLIERVGTRGERVWGKISHEPRSTH